MKNWGSEYLVNRRHLGDTCPQKTRKLWKPFAQRLSYKTPVSKIPMCETTQLTKIKHAAHATNRELGKLVYHGNPTTKGLHYAQEEHTQLILEVK